MSLLLQPKPLLKVTGQAMLRKSSLGVGIEGWHSDRRRRNGFLLFSLASHLLPVSFDPDAVAATAGLRQVALSREKGKLVVKEFT